MCIALAHPAIELYFINMIKYINNKVVRFLHVLISATRRQSRPKDNLFIQHARQKTWEGVKFCFKFQIDIIQL